MSSLASAASVSSLHDIELQLILHCLSAPEILTFARCSHRLLAAADASFGWHRCSALPLHLESIPLDAAGLAARRAPLCVALRFVSEMPVIQTLAGRCKVASLIIRFSSGGGDVTAADAAAMLAGLALQPRLEELHLSLGLVISTALMQVIADLPRLRFLSYSSLHSLDPNDDPLALLATGACSRTLRHVRWTDAHSFVPGGLACDIMSQLPSLTAVTIIKPNLYGCAFRRFFTSPNMARLQFITLAEFKFRGYLKTQRYNRRDHCVGPPPQDFEVVLTALTQLVRLTLVECDGIGALLPALIHSASLRQLIIQPDCDPRNKRWNSTLPKKRTLQWLLQSLPMLFVTLHLPSVRWAGLHAKNVARLREAFAVVADALSPRYRLTGSAAHGLVEPFFSSMY